MTDFREHPIRQGDRFDTLSWMYYTDPYGYVELVKGEYLTNRLSPRTREFSNGGGAIAIPDTDKETAIAGPGLPPWRRF